MFSHICPKPADANGDMQTDDDTARRVEYRRDRISSVDKDKVDEEEEEEDVDEVNDMEE